MTHGERDVELVRTRSSLDVTIAGWLVFTVLNGVSARERTMWVDLAVVAITVLVRVLLARNVLTARIAVHLVVAVSAVGLWIAAALSGATGSIAIWYLTAIPLFTRHLGSERASWIWSGLVALGVMALASLEPRLQPFAEFRPEAAERAFGVATLAVVALGFVRVWRRAHDVQVARLERAREEAEVALRAKSALLRNVGHAFGTPLHAASGSLALLLDEALSPSARGRGETAMTTLAELSHALEGVAVLAELEAGGIEMASEPISLRRVVQAAAERSRELGVRLGGTLEISGAPEDAVVLGDEHRLVSMLAPLVRNAIESSGAGNVVARWHLSKESLVLEVEDQALGKSAAILRELESFQTVDDGYARARAGLGTGLAIARGLASAHGGRLEILDAKEGRGAIVRITLPAPPHAPSGAGEPVRRVVQRVLVVDDDRVQRLVSRGLVEQLGIACDAVESGEAAIARLGAGDIDAVLLDLHMPGLDGFEVARRVRAQPALNGVRLLAVSASQFDAERGRARAVGIDAFVAKPVAREQLRSALGIAPEVADVARLVARSTEPSIDPDVDAAALGRLRGAFTEVELEELSREFLSDARKRTTEIQQALEARDRSRVELAAHTLKGSAGALGVVSVARLAGDLEHRARTLPSLDQDDEALARDLSLALERAAETLLGRRGAA